MGDKVPIPVSVGTFVGNPSLILHRYNYYEVEDLIDTQ
jgi:hypothetical protein